MFKAVTATVLLVRRSLVVRTDGSASAPDRSRADRLPPLAGAIRSMDRTGAALYDD